jgi:hypothetical protein
MASALQAAVEALQTQLGLQAQINDLRTTLLTTEGELLLAQKIQIINNTNLAKAQWVLEDARFLLETQRFVEGMILTQGWWSMEDARYAVELGRFAQMLVDEAAAEAVRIERRAAELAFEADRLANAKTIRDAEREFVGWLTDRGIRDALDDWRRFFDSVRNAPDPWQKRAAGGPVLQGESYVVGEQGPELFVPTTSGTILPSPVTEMNVSQDLWQRGNEPIIVNFILDGETVMQAVVTPERLRPVVDVVQKRQARR